MWKIYQFLKEQEEKKRKFYILNALITPFQDETASFSVSRIPLERAKELYNIEKRLNPEGIVSAIGHESTAKLISELLEDEIVMNRTTVHFQPDDVALAFVLKQRAPEGKILTKEEILKLGLDVFFIIRKT